MAGMLCPCVSGPSLPCMAQAENPLASPAGSPSSPLLSWMAVTAQTSSGPLQKYSQRYKMLHYLSWLQATKNNLRKRVLVPATSDVASTCSVFFFQAGLSIFQT